MKLKPYTPVFLGNFECLSDVLNSFHARWAVNDESSIIVAYYDIEDYTGTAFVLFQDDNTLYEVNGSHCSCYGLEDQWEPEETTLEELWYRFKNHKGEEGYAGAVADFCYRQMNNE